MFSVTTFLLENVIIIGVLTIETYSIFVLMSLHFDIFPTASDCYNQVQNMYVLLTYKIKTYNKIK